MMKKVTFGVLVLFMVLLVACGGGGENAAATDIDIANLPVNVDVETVAAIQDEANVLVLDVREQYEYDESHIPGVTLIPMGEIPNRLSEIPTDQQVIVTCRSGNRSNQVTEFLRQQGYTNVHNMEGGILAWTAAGLPVE